LNIMSQPLSSSSPYTSNAPYNLGGSAWDGTGGQDFFGDPLDQSGAVDVGMDQT